MNSRVEEMENALAPAAGTGISPQSQALEAKERALIYARYEMAIRMPTNWEQARLDILKECRRPTFARDKSVLYGKPIGDDKVEGLGVRFAEMALRCVRNISTDVQTVYEDDQRRVLRVTVTNLCANQAETDEVTVVKTVERSRPGKDGFFISVRNNSRGQPTYTVPATEDDLLISQGRLVSKVRRNLALRHIPADIQEEAERTIRATRQDAAARDPDAERREIFDGFAALNVPVEELEEYLGHDVATASPGELVNLRTVWGTISDGETSWAAVLAHRRAELEKDKAKPAVAPTQRGMRRRAQAQGAAAMEADLPKKDESGTMPPKTEIPLPSEAERAAVEQPETAKNIPENIPAEDPKPQGILIVADGTGEFLGRYTGKLDNLVLGGIMEVGGVDYAITVIRKDKIVLRVLL